MGLYRNRIFPRLLEWASNKVHPERQRLLADAKGVVLELGAGTGISFASYPATVTTLVALEPEAVLLKIAAERTDYPEQMPLHLVAGAGERLPFAENSFDTVVCCLVLCSVAAPELVVKELQRVLKPTGQLLVFEHQRSDRPWLGKVQDLLNPSWNLFSCGCQLNRTTAQLLEQGGFDLTQLEDYHHPRLPFLVAPVLLGVAYPRAIK